MINKLEGGTVKQNFFEEVVEVKKAKDLERAEAERVAKEEKLAAEKAEREREEKYPTMSEPHELPKLPEEMTNKDLNLPYGLWEAKKEDLNYSNDKFITDLRDSFSNIKNRIMQTCQKYETDKYREMKLEVFKVLKNYYFDEHYKGLGSMRMYFPDGNYSTMQGYGPKGFDYHAQGFIVDLFNLYAIICNNEDFQSRNFRINLFSYYAKQIGGVSTFFQICKFQSTNQYKEYSRFGKVVLPENFGNEEWLQDVK